MDNIIIKEIWKDKDIIEWEVFAKAENIAVKQTVYIQKSKIREVCEKIKDYLNLKTECYIEIGNKNKNYTPAFSMKLEKPSITGKLLIELDMEIADSDDKEHRCLFYINTDFGALERLIQNIDAGKNISYLYEV